MKLKPADISLLSDPVQLDNGQRAILAAYVHTEGFEILKQLWEDEVRKYNTRLLNTSPADEPHVIANHYCAKVAAQMYQGWIDRLNQEIEFHAYSISGVGTPDNPENTQSVDEFK
jgi:hypothetical protein